MKLIGIIVGLIVNVYSQQNIIEYLQTATGFDVCAGALIKLNTSAGIDVTTGGPYTVFCAPDTVWNPMGITDGSTLDDTLISYWIINGEFNNANLVSGTYPTLARKLTTLPYEFEYNATSMKITDDGGNVVSTTTLTEVSTPGNIWITNDGVIFPGTILNYLSDNPTTYGTLSAVAGGNPNVAAKLSGPGPFTLFAPPNTAFGAIDPGVLSLLIAPENSADLELVLLHHVLAGKVASSFVTDGLIATTAQGSNLTFTVSGAIFVTDALTRGTSCQIGVDSVDIFRSNGVIHSTACVLTPKSLADVVVENGLIQLATAAQTYGILPVLLSPTPLTLFGPTDAAFSQVNLTDLTAEQIAGVLGYHTVGLGVPSTEAALYSGQNVPTTINATFKVLVNGSITLTDSLSQVATIITVDKFALNGILHIIDSVLIPGTIVQIGVTNPLTSIVAGLAVQNGLADALTGITMFLPTTAALFAPENVGLFSIPGRTANFIFQYHVITKSLFADIPNNPETTTASVIFFNTTSSNLIIKYGLLLDQMGNRVTDENGNTVNIIDLDIVGTDGTINIIDNFLYPFDISSIASIDATAKATSDLTTLVAAYTTAGLDTTLTLPNMLGLTIFAPTNSAFAKLADGLIPYLLTNITLLESVLSLHVYNGTLLAQDIALLGNQGQPITTLAGIDLIIGLTADQAAFTLTDPAGNVITITAFDIFCTNGVVHLIDTVIESSPGAYDFTIADYLAVYNDTDIIFGTFGILTNIITTLPFLSFSMNVSDANAMNTLFAPLDISFGSLNINQTKLLSVTSNPVTLERLLGYHLVSGKVLSTDIMNNSLVTTSSGNNFTTILSGLGVEIMDMDDYNDNSIVTMANIQVTNGIIHIIDRVLGPETGFITKPVTSIYDYIISNQDAKMLTTLATQISRSEELILFLDEFGPFTIFAPNDGAFVSSDIDPTDLAALLSNVTMVELLLTYHLVGGLVYSSNLTDGMMVETFLGENIKISKNGSGVFIKDVSTVNSDAQVVFADIITDSGIIHIIDNVLQYEDGLLTPTSAPSMTPTMATMPPTANTIVNFVIENQEVKELTTLASVITPFVAEVLNMDGPYTLFAPIDSAWNNSDIDATKLEKILKPENNETLTKLLKYHVLDGMVFAENLTDGKTAQTLKGLDITIKIKNDTVFIKDIETSNDDNTAKVTKADIVVSNGIIHLIDGVLSFEEGLLSPDMPTLPPTGASNIIRPSLIIITIIIAIVLG